MDSDTPYDPNIVYRGKYPAVRGLFMKQPFKFLYATAAILSNMVQLPFWIVYYIIPRLRPNPKWSLQTAVVNHIVKRHLHHSGIVGSVTPLSLKPGLEGKRLDVIHPSRENVYVDTCVDPRGVVKPVPLPGVWSPAIPAKGAAAADKPTILHFHGGAFVIGDPRIIYSGHVARVLNKYVAPQVVAAGYRLSSNADGYFPAQLQDAVTWWFSLLERGISPGNIMLSGDSAGGNLAYMLLRYMEGHRDIFPVLPGAILLWSPWVDLTTGFHGPEIVAHRNFPADYIVPNFPEWGAKTMAIEYDATDPWLSPVRGPLLSSVPTFIQTGSSEVLYDLIVLFHKKLAEMEVDGRRNNVEIHVSPECNHDIILLGQLMGFSAEVKAACEHARRFVDANLAKKA